MSNWRYTVNLIKLLPESLSEKKSKNLKCTRQSQKIIWVTVINTDIKSKDKLISVSSFFFSFSYSLEFKVSLLNKIS